MRLFKVHMLGHAGYLASAAAVVLTGGALYGATTSAGAMAFLADHAAAILALSVTVCLTLMIPGYLAFIHETRARREVEARLIELTESLPGVVFQYRTFPDGTSRYEYMSRGVKQLRGVDRDAALKDPELIQGAMLEGDRAFFLRTVAEATRNLTPLELDYRIQREDGAVRWIRSTSAPRKQADGSVLWSGHWGDVTDRVMMERALLDSKEAAEAANQAKTTFVTTMSHEIRTPMSGVLGMLELLARTELQGEQRTMLRVVQDSGSSLLRIIDDILDFSKIEAGKLDLTPVPTAIAKVVDAVFTVYAGIASNKGLALSRFVDPRIGAAVMVDPLRLRQILNNLLSNAIKFTPSGQVELLAELVDRRQGRDVVRFSVRDTGIGISDEAQKRLFRPYAQALAGTAHQYGGTGLGLAICQRLATMMGGAVGVASQLGKGTVMMLTVPLQVTDAASLDTEPAHGAGEAELAVRRAPSVADAQDEGTLVLIADDHPVNRMILMRQVNTLGYAVEAAQDGLEALDMWRSDRFRIVITDCDMPELNGYDLARRIREIEALEARPRTPIVACTAYAILGESEACLQAGMDDYLSKPVDLRRLQEKLALWLPIPPGSGTDAEPGPAIDAKALREISAGNSALERELLLRFGEYTDEDAAQLDAALGSALVDEVRSIAHRIKGAARTVGAMALADAAERLERAARSGDAAALGPHRASLGRELERLRHHLNPLRRHPH